MVGRGVRVIEIDGIDGMVVVDGWDLDIDGVEACALAFRMCVCFSKYTDIFLTITPLFQIKSPPPPQ